MQRGKPPKFRAGRCRVPASVPPGGSLSEGGFRARAAWGDSHPSERLPSVGTDAPSVGLRSNATVCAACGPHRKTMGRTVERQAETHPLDPRPRAPFRSLLVCAKAPERVFRARALLFRRCVRRIVSQNGGSVTTTEYRQKPSSHLALLL